MIKCQIPVFQEVNRNEKSRFVHIYRLANQIAPTFNLGADPKTGARIAIHVIKS